MLGLIFSMVFFGLLRTSVEAVAPPELNHRKGRTPAPVFLDAQIALAMDKAGCVPDGTQGAWTYNVRRHRAEKWNPVPSAALQDCMNRVLPAFPAALTGVVLSWPPRAH